MFTAQLQKDTQLTIKPNNCRQGHIFKYFCTHHLPCSLSYFRGCHDPFQCFAQKRGLHQPQDGSEKLQASDHSTDTDNTTSVCYLSIFPLQHEYKWVKTVCADNDHLITNCEECSAFRPFAVTLMGRESKHAHLYARVQLMLSFMRKCVI